MLFESFLIFITFLSCSTAQSYNYGFDISHLARRQNPSVQPVIGKLPLAPDGSIPARPDIHDMKKDKYTWDLFILALSMFQYVSQDHPMSWYQIAGIHGVPFRSWGGVEAVEGASQSGYCTHSSVLFPMWHRPYLALYEQQLFKFVNGIANLFPAGAERSQYQQAAAVFRVPYWDWSIVPPAGETHLPQAFWSPVISQYGPNGVQNIRNPLYSYKFHPLKGDEMIWAPLRYWNETKRYPDVNISATDPKSQNYQASNQLLQKLPELQQRLYILFSSYHDFNSFSNKAWAASQNLSALDSIESIHDVIHVVGGGKGHMTYVPLSSFDPLFFLHHAMTDRLISMWQVLNPSSWILPMASEETSFTSLKGTIQTSASPLTPFFASSDGTFWTSDTCRATETLGYVYSDIGSHAGFNEKARQSLIKKINDWYGTSSPVGIHAKSKQQSADKIVTSTADGDSRKFPNQFQPNLKLAVDNPQVGNAIEGGYYTEWIANVQVNAEALDGVFGVHVFIGTPPIPVGDWKSAPNHVGAVSIFAMNRTTGSTSRISGTIPLTISLMKLFSEGMIQSLSAIEVVPFLQRTLSVRVLGGNDEEVALDKVDGLQVDVSSANVKIPESDFEFPKWGPAVPRMRVEL